MTASSRRLYALVLEGRSADHRHEPEIHGALADRLLEIGHARNIAVEILLEQLLVFLDRHFDELRTRGFRGLAHVSGDFGQFIIGAEILFLPDERLHRDKIDDAFERRLAANRKLDYKRPRAETIDHHLDAACEIRTRSVHLIDEAYAGYAIAVRLTPNSFRLRLHTGDRIEHRNRAIEDAQRAFHFDGEIDVARRIDDVDAVVLPEAGRGGGRDRDAALLLLLHEVHGGGAVVHFADLMRTAGIIEDALGRRRSCPASICAAIPILR